MRSDLVSLDAKEMSTWNPFLTYSAPTPPLNCQIFHPHCIHITTYHVFWICRNSYFGYLVWYVDFLSRIKMLSFIHSWHFWYCLYSFKARNKNWRKCRMSINFYNIIIVLSLFISKHFYFWFKNKQVWSERIRKKILKPESCKQLPKHLIHTSYFVFLNEKSK